MQNYFGPFHFGELKPYYSKYCSNFIIFLSCSWYSRHLISHFCLAREICEIKGTLTLRFLQYLWWIVLPESVLLPQWSYVCVCHILPWVTWWCCQTSVSASSCKSLLLQYWQVFLATFSGPRTQSCADCKKIGCLDNRQSMDCDARLLSTCLFMPTFCRKVGQTDLVFGVRSGFISKSVHAKLLVSVCNGYDLGHPG